MHRLLTQLLVLAIILEAMAIIFLLKQLTPATASVFSNFL